MKKEAEATNNEKGLEEKISELKAIISDLENPEKSLEEAFRLYKDGMKCLSECQEKIDRVEKELQILEEE